MTYIWQFADEAPLGISRLVDMQSLISKFATHKGMERSEPKGCGLTILEEGHFWASSMYMSTEANNLPLLCPPAAVLELVAGPHGFVKERNSLHDGPVTSCPQSTTTSCGLRLWSNW